MDNMEDKGAVMGAVRRNAEHNESPRPGQRCLACGQVVPPPAGRTCCDCHRPIGRHDKWRFGPEGKPVHKDCSNPKLEA